MTFFDLLLFLIMGFCLYKIVKPFVEVEVEVVHEEDLVIQAQKEALLAQPYYYYELVKDGQGGKQYLLYRVTDDEYVGQAGTLAKIKKLAKDINPDFPNVFLKNTSTNKISVI